MYAIIYWIKIRGYTDNDVYAFTRPDGRIITFNHLEQADAYANKLETVKEWHTNPNREYRVIPIDSVHE